MYNNMKNNTENNKKGIFCQGNNLFRNAASEYAPKNPRQRWSPKLKKKNNNMVDVLAKTMTITVSFTKNKNIFHINNLQ